MQPAPNRGGGRPSELLGGDSARQSALLARHPTNPPIGGEGEGSVKVLIGEIKTSGRFREDMGNVESLAVDIQRHGLYHPIIVSPIVGGEGEWKFRLRAGERRLRAHEMLGMKEIEVKLLSEVDELEGREVELEENLQRKDFTWQEEVRAKAEIDKLKRDRYGSAIRGHGGGWSIKNTADSLGESVGAVSQDIRLAQAIAEFPELRSEKNKAAAWKKFQRMRERGISEELSNMVSSQELKEIVVEGDSIKELGRMASESVDLIIADPPYGIELGKIMKSVEAWGGEEGVYPDEKWDTFDMVERVVGECARVLKEGRHMYMFFATQFYPEMRKLLEGVELKVAPVPLIWHKTGGGGARGNDLSYASNYESFFLCWKGKGRALVRQGISNVFVEPRVPPQRKIHPAEKPTSLLRKLVEQSSLPGELVVDPFGGSGSTVVAAIETKRRGWTCEKDRHHHDQIVLRVQKCLSTGTVSTGS